MFGMSYPNEISVPIEGASVFTFAEYTVQMLTNGQWIQVQGDAITYFFSHREIASISWLLAVCQWFLSALALLSVVCFLLGPNRSVSGSILFAALIMLISPLFSLNEAVHIAPFWELLRVSLAFVLVKWGGGKVLRGHQNGQALLVYASQTGGAKYLAERFRKASQDLIDICCISTLSPPMLSRYPQVLFVVSTYGEGEAPDTARKFVSQLNKLPQRNTETQFGVLALGDKTYKTFCAFGHALSDLLAKKGFQEFLALKEVDRMDPKSVENWWQEASARLGIMQSQSILEYDSYQVMENECLNPLQPHRHVHRIRLTCPKAHYAPGDVLAVLPDSDQEHERQYSIASCEVGEVELLVRRYIREDGSIGVGSGLLCGAKVGQIIKAQTRQHETFHLVPNAPLIMIGAGTGLAPYIGFLKQRQKNQDKAPCWLLFGEQYEQHDFYFSEELKALQRSGVLTRLDCAWSRSDGCYITALLEQQRDELTDWVARGAQIYVCGSRNGFGESTLECLQSVLGQDTLEGCLHKDLY